jgi:hypothetical protein
MSFYQSLLRFKDGSGSYYNATVGCILMKIALVHDYLTQPGGAERVFELLCKRYPNADILHLYTIQNYLLTSGRVRFTQLDCKIFLETLNINIFDSWLPYTFKLFAPLIWKITI